MIQVLAFAALLAFVLLQIVILTAAVIVRDGWQGWREFWLSGR